MDNSFPKSLRIRQNHQYHAFFKTASYQDGPFFRLYSAPKVEAEPRCGLIASKKSIGNAVARNRSRRLMKEAVRRSEAFRNGAHDIVLVARRRIVSASGSQVADSLNRMLR